ncbi:MAG: ribosomal RNA small subunit methyltransferase A [Planctomycetes bacterium]|nr:ribosomal RNA small subunit methyltransferase A [Planctomycetota bacterium]
MAAERDSFAHYRARLDALGFTPSSTLGQNFLLDPSLHRWLAEQAAPTAQDTAVEIGVGLGFLTRELAQRAGRVLGIEIDPRLFELASADLADLGNVDLVAGDALGGPERSLRPEIAAAAAAARVAGGRFLLVANLPYAVSGPLLAEVVALPELPERAVLLVQKELAQRVAAGTGGAEFGGLGVVVQSVFHTRVLRDVPPQVFRPRPKVVSAVLQLERRDDIGPELGSGDARRQFARFVRRMFQQRRKVLRHTLPAACAAIGRESPQWEADLLMRRAEELQPAEIVALWRRCAGT